MLWIRSIQGSFRNVPHTPAANYVSLLLAWGELSFTSEHHSLPYAECLSCECPEIGTLLKHKSPERKHLTFCCNHSLLGRTHINAYTHEHRHRHTHTDKETMISVSKPHHSPEYERGPKENVTFPRCVLSHGNHGN